MRSDASSVIRRCITTLAVLGGAVSVYAMRQADPDFFGYLAYGRLFVERGGPVALDPFGYTSPGGHWVAFEYLAQAVLWLAYSHFGAIGLIALKACVAGGTLRVVYAAIRTVTNDPFVWAPAFLLCAATLSMYFGFRPQLFTFLFFAVFVAAVFRYLARGSAMLWPLPIVMLIWANMHGGFVSGFGALGLGSLIVMLSRINEGATVQGSVRAARPLLATLAACIPATFVNPEGTRLWSYVLTELSHSTNRQNVVEWMPISWARDPWSATAIALLACAIIALAAFAPRRRRAMGLYPWQWLVVSAPVIALAFLTARNVTIAAIWCAPVAALLRASNDPPGRVVRWTWLGATCGALTGVFVLLAAVWFRPAPEIVTAGPAVLGSRNPCRVVHFMQDRGLTGNVYTPLWWGSYVTWRLYPGVRVSMDGRNVSAFADDLIVENFAFYGNAPRFRDRDAPLRHDTDFLLVPSDRPILSLIHTDPRWRSLYADADASLFERVDRNLNDSPSSSSTLLSPAGADACAGVLRVPPESPARIPEKRSDATRSDALRSPQPRDEYTQEDRSADRRDDRSIHEAAGHEAELDAVNRAVHHAPEKVPFHAHHLQRDTVSRR